MCTPYVWGGALRAGRGFGGGKVVAEVGFEKGLLGVKVTVGAFGVYIKAVQDAGGQKRRLESPKPR